MMTNPALRSRYREPWRHYHTAKHVSTMEDDLWQAVEDGYTRTHTIACNNFIWYHDAVYDPVASKGGNETRSAELALSEMTEDGYDAETIRQTVGMIRCTIDHQPTMNFPDSPIMLDIDMAVLGMSPVRYAEYACGIRTEYDHVSAPQYRQGRRMILTAFLARPRLYNTDWAFNRWEQQARTNIEDEIFFLGN